LIRLLRSLVLVATIAIGGLAAYWWIVPEQRPQLLSVQTGSMSPAISPGDLVAVTSVPNLASLQVGDVITFTTDEIESSITHRIIAIPNDESDLFITQGDANNTADKPIARDQIIGKVSTTVPGGGSFVQFVATPIGLALVVYLPAILILWRELKLLTKHFEKTRPWRHPAYKPEKQPIGPSQLLSLGLIVSLLISVPTIAQLSSTASLTGNTITTTLLDDGGGDDGCNETIIDVSLEGDGEGDTSVLADIDTEQTATSGDAQTSTNTTGGSATSGDASNCNSTTIDFNVSN
jgi:signal peptidase I